MRLNGRHSRVANPVRRPGIEPWSQWASDAFIYVIVQDMCKIFIKNLTVVYIITLALIWLDTVTQRDVIIF